MCSSLPSTFIRRRRLDELIAVVVVVRVIRARALPGRPRQPGVPDRRGLARAPAAAAVVVDRIRYPRARRRADARVRILRRASLPARGPFRDLTPARRGRGHPLLRLRHRGEQQRVFVLVRFAAEASPRPCPSVPAAVRAALRDHRREDELRVEGDAAQPVELPALWISPVLLLAVSPAAAAAAAAAADLSELRARPNQHRRPGRVRENRDVHVHVLAERHHRLQILQVHRDLERLVFLRLVPKHRVLRRVHADRRLQRAARRRVRVHVRREFQVLPRRRRLIRVDPERPLDAFRAVRLGQARDRDVVLPGLEVRQQPRETPRPKH
eukprot:30996-Pelagococcus_subviridis.AAC.23